MPAKGYGRGPILEKHAFSERDLERLAKFLIKEKVLELTELTTAHQFARQSQLSMINGNREEAFIALKRVTQALERLSKTLKGEEKLIERIES